MSTRVDVPAGADVADRRAPLAGEQVEEPHCRHPPDHGGVLGAVVLKLPSPVCRRAARSGSRFGGPPAALEATGLIAHLDLHGLSTAMPRIHRTQPRPSGQRAPVLIGVLAASDQRGASRSGRGFGRAASVGSHRSAGCAFTGAPRTRCSSGLGGRRASPGRGRLGCRWEGRRAMSARQTPTVRARPVRTNANPAIRRPASAAREAARRGRLGTHAATVAFSCASSNGVRSGAWASARTEERDDAPRADVGGGEHVAGLVQQGLAPGPRLGRVVGEPGGRVGGLEVHDLGIFGGVM